MQWKFSSTQQLLFFFDVEMLRRGMYDERRTEMTESLVSFEIGREGGFVGALITPLESACGVEDFEMCAIAFAMLERRTSRCAEIAICIKKLATKLQRCAWLDVIVLVTI